MISKSASAMVFDIDELLGDQALWQRLAKNSRELIDEKYTWVKLFELMDGAIDKVLSEYADASARPAVA